MNRKKHHVILLGVLFLFAMFLSSPFFFPAAQASIDLDIIPTKRSIELNEYIGLSASCWHCPDNPLYWFFCDICDDDLTWEWTVIPPYDQPDADYDFLFTDTPTPVFKASKKGTYQVYVTACDDQECGYSAFLVIGVYDPRYDCSLSSKYPFIVYESPAYPDDVECSFDNDGNGLDDLAEDAIARCFTPMLAFDAGEECWSLGPDEPHMVYNMSIDGISDDGNAFHLVIRYGMIWQWDGGFQSSDVCAGPFRDSHPGDTDGLTVYAWLKKRPGQAEWYVELEYIQGFAEVKDLRFYVHSPPLPYWWWMNRYETHPLVYPTEGKHHLRWAPGEYEYGVCHENALGNLIPYRVPLPEHLPHFFPDPSVFPAATGQHGGPPIHVVDDHYEWINACSLLKNNPDYERATRLRNVDLGDWLRSPCLPLPEFYIFPEPDPDPSCCESPSVPYPSGLNDGPLITDDNFLSITTSGIWTLVNSGFITDIDGDTLPLWEDPCPVVNGNYLDSDGDGLCDPIDICPDDPDNDADGDGLCDDNSGGVLTVTTSYGLISRGPQEGPFDPSSQLFVLHNPGDDSIEWAATKTQPWVSLSPTSGIMTAGAGANITVSIKAGVANYLSPGTYMDTISFTNTTNGNGNDTRMVSLTVDSVGVLEVAPTEGMASMGPQWGPFDPSTQVYTLQNSGGSPINWTATKALPWVSLSPRGGTLPGSASANVTVSINTNANFLSPGSYNDLVLFTNWTNGNGNTSRNVNLTVNEVPGVLSVGPSNGLTASGSQGGIFAPPYQWYSLTNTGGSSFDWTATKTQPWVTLSATNGTLGLNQSVDVKVSINDNAKSLLPGLHSDTVSFTNTTNGNGNTTRTVDVTVEAVGVLAVTPSDGMASSGPEGGPFSPPNKVYTLTNTGGAPINWTAAKYYAQPWVTLSATNGTLASGESTNVVVSMNANAESLALGAYSDTVIFTNTTNHGGDTVRPVNLSIIGGTPGNLYVFPADEFTASGNEGGPFGPTYKTFSLMNTGESSINWTATKYFEQPWVNLSATSGTLANGENIAITVLINENANSLLPGLHNETILFTNTTNGIGNTTRAVSLTVTPVLAPGNLLVVQSEGFTSSGNQGGPFSPPYKSYTLTNTGQSSINWTATKYFAQSWVSLSATSGILELNGENVTIAVSINTDANGLPPGLHNETVLFTNTTNGNGNTSRAVNLTVEAFPGELLVVQSDDFESSGDEGGTFSPPYKGYTLVNTGGTPITWTATKTQPWVSLTETDGGLVNGENTIITVSVNSNAKSLSPGTYSDTVNFTNTTNGAGNTARAVNMTVSCVPNRQPDCDCDGDVDGLDLAIFVEQLGFGTSSVSIEEFAEGFGLE